MTKYILTLLTLGSLFFSSKAQIAVQLKFDSNNIIYRGFDNILSISGPSSLSENDYELTCSNCTVRKTTRIGGLPENTVCIHTKGPGNAILEIEMNDGTVNEFVFRISNLPVAELLINGIESGGSLNQIAGSEDWILSIGYPKGVSLAVESNLVSWECAINEQFYASMSNELTPELISAIREADIGTELNFVYVDIDPRSGIMRKKSATFRI